ncbi:MAG: AIR synthase-related protein, partial [Terracidiphilus sp.]
EKDAIVLLWPIPRGQEPDPKLKVPLNPPPISQYPLPALEREPRARAEANASDAEAEKNLTAFGSSEFAKVVLGATWGTPPSLDLDAEASLHNLLTVLAWRKLIYSARDISDGGIAVALAQATFTKGIGATVEQDPSLLAHPLFGLFAEPASTVIVTTDPGNLSEIDAMAGQNNFFSARIGTTGGNRFEFLVDGDTFISAPLAELRKLWANALESSLHDEVLA